MRYTISPYVMCYEGESSEGSVQVGSVVVVLVLHLTH